MFLCLLSEHCHSKNISVTVRDSACEPSVFFVCTKLVVSEYFLNYLKITLIN